MGKYEYNKYYPLHVLHNNYKIKRTALGERRPPPRANSSSSSSIVVVVVFYLCFVGWSSLDSAVA